MKKVVGSGARAVGMLVVVRTKRAAYSEAFSCNHKVCENCCLGHNTNTTATHSFFNLRGTEDRGVFGLVILTFPQTDE